MILPVLLVGRGVSVTGVGYVKALYPFVWAAAMIATGHLADRSAASPDRGRDGNPGGRPGRHHRGDRPCAGRRAGRRLPPRRGHSLVYPTLLAGVSDAAHPAWRAPALGVYRFWRDCGYAIGTLIGAITAALASLDAAIGVAAVLTAASGLLAWAFMTETQHDSGQN